MFFCDPMGSPSSCMGCPVLEAALAGRARLLHAKGSDPRGVLGLSYILPPLVSVKAGSIPPAVLMRGTGFHLSKTRDLLGAETSAKKCVAEREKGSFSASTTGDYC